MPRIYSSPQINRTVSANNANNANNLNQSSSTNFGSSKSLVSNSRKGSNDDTTMADSQQLINKLEEIAADDSSKRDSFKKELDQEYNDSYNRLESKSDNNSSTNSETKLLDESITAAQQAAATTVTSATTAKEIESIKASKTLEPIRRQLNKSLLSNFEKEAIRAGSTSPKRKFQLEKKNTTIAIAERKSSNFSDVKQEVITHDFAKLLNKLDDLTSRLEKSVSKTESIVHTDESVVKLNGDSKDLSNEKAEAKGSPVFEVSNSKRWSIENQTNRDNLIVDKANTKHTVFINNCEGCKIKVNSKVNSILVDSCKHLRLELIGVSTTFEIKNSQNVEIVLLEEISSVNLNNVSDIKIYLTAKSLNSVIESSRSFGITLFTPNNENENEHVAQLVPEKYRIKFNSKSKKVNVNPSE